ncbi:MAG: MerR family transcriptional regulator [Terriglobales bacterium]
MERRFTSAKVVALTGMTPRQLQWWDERGIVVPAREGRRRIYSLADLAEIAVIAELRARGLSLQRIRKVMRFLQREFGKRLVETVTGGSEYHLLTDGKTVYLKTSPQQVIDILKNARQAMFAVCLSDAVRQVKASAGGDDAPPPVTQDSRNGAVRQASRSRRMPSSGAASRLRHQRRTERLSA